MGQLAGTFINGGREDVRREYSEIFAGNHRELANKHRIMDGKGRRPEVAERELRKLKRLLRPE